MARIERRIAKERQNPGASEREKWRHMHENPETLIRLQSEYYSALSELQNRSAVQIYEINTSEMPQMQVANFITTVIREQIGNRSNREGESSWRKMTNERLTEQLVEKPVVVYSSV